MAVDKRKQERSYPIKKGRHNAGPPRIRCADFLLPVEKCEIWQTQRIRPAPSKPKSGGTSKHPGRRRPSRSTVAPSVCRPPLFIRKSNLRRSFHIQPYRSGKSARKLSAAVFKDAVPMRAEVDTANQPQKLTHIGTQKLSICSQQKNHFANLLRIVNQPEYKKT